MSLYLMNGLLRVCGVRLSLVELRVILQGSENSRLRV